MSVEYELPIKTSNRMQRKRKCHPHHHGLVDRGWDRMSVEYELPIKTSKRMQKKRENITLIATITIITTTTTIITTTTLIIMDWWIEDGIG